MDNDRYIRLLTKDLCDELTEAEREELAGLLRENKEYRDQKEILKEYWEKERGQEAANAAMFKRVIERIKVEEGKFTMDGTKREEHEFTTDGTKREVGKFKKEEAGLEEGGSRMPWRLWYSAAAILLLVAGTFAWRHFQASKTAVPALATHWLQRSTQPVRKSVLTLSDGTTVALNSATTIKYPEHFGDHTREVYLD